MKTLVSNYIFSAAAKQITFTDYPSIKLDQILLITNVTDNVIIYNFADPTAGGTLTGNVLTLGYNTTTMSDSDRLQIFIDDYVVPSTEASLTAVQIRLDTVIVDLDEIRANTEFGTTSDAPIFVNPGALDYTTDSVSISGANIDNIIAGIDSTNTLLNVLTAKEATINLDVSAINLNTDEIETKLDTISNNIIAAVADLDEIRVNTEFGTTSDAPIFVNPGTLDYTTDSVSISGANIDNIVAGVNDRNILQTASIALSSRFVIPGAHRVYNIFGITTAIVNQYIQFYNNLSLSGTPIGIFYIPANSNFSFDLERGLNFSNNVVIVNSLTPVTYTPGNDDLFITVIHN